MSDESETMSKKSRKSRSTPTFSDDEHIEPPAFSLATLGLRRVGSAPPPKPQPQQPIQMLNARGMPARIRKRNRFFFDDNIINDDKPLRMSLSPRKMPMKGSASPHKTPTKVLKKRKGVISRYMRSDEKKKSTEVPTTPTRNSSHSHASSSTTNTTPKSSTRQSGVPITPTKTNASSKANMTVATIIPADKKIGQSIGLRLRNLLKLPKAHRWVIFEWFYSFLDKALFEGENDFQVCLAESFPNLCTRQLTRAEWRQIRALMGKPRRCSQAFFEEERRELERRRLKIRYIQTRKSGDIKDLNYVRDLPDKIPLPLPIGTKVTARLRVPQDGIFSGTVDAFDSMCSTYRITFDRNGLGTHSIPDFEIVSENFHEMLPIQSITRDSRPNLMSIFNGSVSPLRNMRNIRSALNMNLNKSDPVLAQEVIESPFKDPVLGRDNINGYPAKLLETLVRLKRALASKRSKLQRLCEMNNEAELKASQQLAAAHNNSNSSSDESQNTNETVPQLSEEFQRRYASVVISMEKMNRDMQDYLNDVQAFAGDLTRDPQVQAMLAPSYLREKCREAAEDAVQRNNQGTVQNKNVLGLIKNLATVLLVASHLGNDGNSAEVSKVLEGCIEEVRSSLCGVNVETFQKNVQIHLHHVRMLAANNNMMVGNTAISTAGGAIDR
ncbi:protein lin-9 homolog [Eurosta solidaginis]|uniref:protein lin-9 homolog n=1 Tax=Eurosta solidaginis TaxID=178769 RepID=UPI0035306F64